MHRNDVSKLLLFIDLFSLWGDSFCQFLSGLFLFQTIRAEFEGSAASDNNKPGIMKLLQQVYFAVTCSC